MLVGVAGSWEWDNEGRMTRATYPLNEAVYGYSYDTMGRLSGMTNVQTGQPVVSGVSYNHADQLTAIGCKSGPRPNQRRRPCDAPTARARAAAKRPLASALGCSPSWLKREGTPYLFIPKAHFGPRSMISM